MSELTETFHALVGDVDYPMFIVTVICDDARDGCLVGFTTQASIDPARFLIRISKVNRTYRLARGAGALAVHVVAREDADLAELFGDEVDKFARMDWEPGPRGLPILAACPSWFAGAVLDRMDCGDHVAFLLEPFAAHHEPGGGGLEFQRAKAIQPGRPA